MACDHPSMAPNHLLAAKLLILYLLARWLRAGGFSAPFLPRIESLSHPSAADRPRWRPYRRHRSCGLPPAAPDPSRSPLSPVRAPVPRTGYCGPKDRSQPSRHALELLGNCARTITVARPAGSKVFHRLRTPVPMAPQTIGEHIHRKRRKLGLPHWQLAERLGVCRAMLGSWEANHYQSEGGVRERIVAWLGFDPRQREDQTQQQAKTQASAGYLLRRRKYRNT